MEMHSIHFWKIDTEKMKSCLDADFVTPQVVAMAICGATTSGDEVGIMMTLVFQWKYIVLTSYWCHFKQLSFEMLQKHTEILFLLEFVSCWHTFISEFELIDWYLDDNYIHD